MRSKLNNFEHVQVVGPGPCTERGGLTRAGARHRGGGVLYIRRLWPGPLYGNPLRPPPPQHNDRHD